MPYTFIDSFLSTEMCALFDVLTDDTHVLRAFKVPDLSLCLASTIMRKAEIRVDRELLVAARKFIRARACYIALSAAY